MFALFQDFCSYLLTTLEIAQPKSSANHTSPCPVCTKIPSGQEHMALRAKRSNDYVVDPNQEGTLTGLLQDCGWQLAGVPHQERAPVGSQTVQSNQRLWLDSLRFKKDLALTWVQTS
jgi:hypothetical protein